MTASFIILNKESVIINYTSAGYWEVDSFWRGGGSLVFIVTKSLIM